MNVVMIGLDCIALFALTRALYITIRRYRSAIHFLIFLAAKHYSVKTAQYCVVYFSSNQTKSHSYKFMQSKQLKQICSPYTSQCYSPVKTQLQCMLIADAAYCSLTQLNTTKHSFFTCLLALTHTFPKTPLFPIFISRIFICCKLQLSAEGTKIN